ncbi:PAS domain-containing methyl-accepting chemotaxis protein [Peteryoungia desertarenae]|uniref:PAS domain-containing methyl-accepting chemotaxis protein n=1 Tax=Peteryoungia desertarenae TaxID=1813451 RepID=A0ABX6QM07_9HYPH|nr:PAS domain-containing methyl-accepting chemotaxis protein [Peteryoungia desertarenae]QLF69626.1 PAS domain-containing methyl-accepting chemotaxis protein [Peteryoungia desertarenae]
MPLSSFFGRESRAILEALGRSQAVIEFDVNGIILNANKNFCDAVGYALNEIVGQHHRMFVSEEYAVSKEYKDFWKRLASGDFFTAEYQRFGKGGREIWIEATYNPVFRGGKPYKVIKFATDITERKRQNLENSGKLAAISRAQAVIEFTPDGTILTANENFLKTVGYTLDEIAGKHHSIFCEPDFIKSPEYNKLWEDLRAGQFKSGEFTRLGKNGKRVFIQASYNPIFDSDGKVFKVVKFAVDVTGRVGAVESIAAGLARLSECNIRVTIDEPFIPEFERLRNDFNTAISEFQKTLESVLGETGTLTDNSNSLKNDADTLGRRTEQQAAALEEASAALEQITATVKEASIRARDTREIVQEARTATGESVRVVAQTVDAISRIEKASKEIGSIIDVIDQIAFQTNLLALNAGVEAARAGEAGKGFAVVAQEVRDLAQRSANAAREISSLILNSTTQVDEGVKLVNATGEALNRIEKYVNEINLNVDAIATGANEQASSLSEINRAVNQLDQATQDNAALVSSIASAGEIMAVGANKMKTLVDIFKLNRRAARREPGSEAAGAGSHVRSRQNIAA